MNQAKVNAAAVGNPRADFRVEEALLRDPQSRQMMRTKSVCFDPLVGPPDTPARLKCRRCGESPNDISLGDLYQVAAKAESLGKREAFV